MGILSFAVVPEKAPVRNAKQAVSNRHIISPAKLLFGRGYVNFGGLCVRFLWGCLLALFTLC